MKPFVLKQHEKMAPIARAIREDEMGHVAGGLCPKGKDVSTTVNSDGTGSSDDGCDKE